MRAHLYFYKSMSLFMTHLSCSQPAGVHAKSWFGQDPNTSKPKKWSIGPYASSGFFLYALHAIYVSRISGKLSFCLFGTEFSENLKVFGRKSSEIVFFWAIFGENFHKSTVLELSFLAKTEFLKIFGIWVLEKSELSFSILYKKKPGLTVFAFNAVRDPHLYTLASVQ